MRNLKQILITGTVSVGLLFDSGCAYIAAAPLAYALASAVEQRIEVEAGKAKGKEEYSAKQKSNYQEIMDTVEKGICYDAELADLANKIVKIISEENLRKYKGPRKNLDELEGTLDSLRVEVIDPSIELLKEYKRVEKKKLSNLKRNHELVFNG